MAAAMALRSIAGQTGVIAGPAVGGIVFAIEPVAVYIVVTALLIVSLLGILAMRPAAATFISTEPVTFDTLVAGVRFIWRTRMLLGAISLDLIAVLLGDAIALAPVFASSILGTGPIGLGLLRTSPSIGALIAAVWLARRPLVRRAGPTLLAVVAIFGVGTDVFGLS
jgi:hypothetical protein